MVTQSSVKQWLWFLNGTNTYLLQSSHKQKAPAHRAGAYVYMESETK